MRLSCAFCLLYLVFSVIVITNAKRWTKKTTKRLKKEKDKSTWFNRGFDEIRKSLSKEQNTKVAKNIIVFIGDGMGVSTVTAARILAGQKKNKPGEENVLSFENFNNVALSKVYNVDSMTPDSASTATAILCGSKTNLMVLGMDGHAEFGNCAASETNAEKLDSILKWAQKAGKRTGIVTTARVTHASPAAAYAHTPSRFWEGDTNMSEDDAPCKDIARQLIEDNRDINVILGGGRTYLLPVTEADPETKTVESNQREDGRNLIEKWKKDKMRRAKKAKYVWNREQFMKVNDKFEFLLGLFNPSHMDYDLMRVKSGPTSEPSLAEMVEKAIDILEEGDNGFFLLVEAARIDHGHHANLPKLALYEVHAFDEAVKVARRNTDFKDTIMVVTADHSHVFGIAGYLSRGDDILGLSKIYNVPYTALDGKPFSVLQYGNGPGFSEPRPDLTANDTTVDDFTFPSGVPLSSATHAGEDVAIYANGPMSHLLHGVQEQSYIAHVMAYAACIGPYSGEKLRWCLRNRNV